MPEGRRQQEPIPTLFLVQLPPKQASGPQWPGWEGDRPAPGGGGRCRELQSFHTWLMALHHPPWGLRRTEPLPTAWVTPAALVSGEAFHTSTCLTHFKKSESPNPESHEVEPHLPPSGMRGAHLGGGADAQSHLGSEWGRTEGALLGTRGPPRRAASLGSRPVVFLAVLPTSWVSPVPAFSSAAASIDDPSSRTGLCPWAH